MLPVLFKYVNDKQFGEHGTPCVDVLTKATEPLFLYKDYWIIHCEHEKKEMEKNNPKPHGFHLFHKPKDNHVSFDMSKCLQRLFKPNEVKVKRRINHMAKRFRKCLYRINLRISTPQWKEVMKKYGDTVMFELQRE